jgi:hypothetical protein
MDLVQALLIAVGALSSAVVFMFVTFLSIYREVKADLRGCEQSKTEFIERILTAVEKIGTLTR